MYQAFHQIVPVTERQAAVAGAVTYDVVGPVCESGDWIGRDRALQVEAGDLLAVLSAGAYCMAMASNYNASQRPAVVLVANGEARLMRRRETYEDLLRPDVWPLE